MKVTTKSKQVESKAKSLSKNKLHKMAKGFIQEFVKGRPDFLSDELEKYKDLKVIVMEKQSK
jgi:hypothetical protein